MAGDIDELIFSVRYNLARGLHNKFLKEIQQTFFFTMPSSHRLVTICRR